MFGFDDDDAFGAFDPNDFGEARDPTDFITPDGVDFNSPNQSNQSNQQTQQIANPQPTSPSPQLQNPFSPINVTQSLSPAPAPIQFNALSPNYNNNNNNSANSAATSQSGYRKSKWTPEEDEMLRNSVKIHGTKNWTAVSTLVPGRNPKQCRERWTAQLDPALTRDDWTPQEDATLLHIHKLHGNAWAKIASFLPGRSSNAVKNRFNWLSRRHFPQAMSAIYIPQQQQQQQNMQNMQNISGMQNMQNMQFQQNMQNMQNMQNVQMQPQNMQMQMQMQMQIPRYNSLSPAQCGNFGFSDPSLELPPPRQAQSATGSLTDNALWDDYAPFQTSQSPIDELCGDFDWNMN